jgi:pimeloyl-ACP methyl ester carboxylesterase
MTEPVDGLPLPVEPLTPRPEAARDLRARLHRHLDLAPPHDAPTLAKAHGLEYELAGDADGEAVLLLHAATCTAFAPLMTQPALRRYQLVRYHRRGFAGSDPLANGGTLATGVHDALALLDHLGIDRAHIVGHSGSGVLALELALAAPTRVRSVVLAEPAIHSIDTRANDISRRAIGPLLELAKSGEPRRAIERWMRGISLNWRAELTRTVPGGPQQTIEDAEAFFADVDAVYEWTFDHEGIAALGTPMLYVLSAGADGLTRRIAAEFVERAPATEVVEIAETTHMLHTDQPTLVAEALAAFFDDSPAQKGSPMTAATVVLVHGPTGTPAVWSRLVALLEAAGIPAVAVHLPSSLPESESDLDDATVLRSVLDDLDGPAVLVGHSGGVFPITEVGGHPAVRHLVYLDGPLPDAGEALFDLIGPGDVDDSFSASFVFTRGGVAFDTDALAAHLQSRGWRAEDARELAAGVVPSRRAAQVRSITAASWRVVPNTFIGYADSQTQPHARARFAARATNALELPGDHFALWQRPGELAQVIVRIARDSVPY